MTTNIGIKFDVHWQMTHVEYANDVIYLHNIERIPPYNTRLESKKYLILKPRSTPSSIPI